MGRSRSDAGADRGRATDPTSTRPTDAGPTDAGRTDAGSTDAESTAPGFTDDELTALALADVPGRPPAADAVPLATYLDDAPGLLPAWYMPTPMTRIRPRWRTPVVVAIVAAFVAIEAFGLCSTFGQIVPA